MSHRWLLGAVLMIFATSCGDRPQLSVRILDCGKIRFESPSAFGINPSEIETRELAVPCYIVEHPQGRLLWNAGHPTYLAGQGWVAPPPRTISAPGVQVRLEKTLAESLAEIDLDLSSFDFVAFSHMHFDHVGAANEIRDATFLTRVQEYDAAFAEELSVPLFNPDFYSALEQFPKEVIEGDHDVFGDGSVLLVSAPGHTPGHQVLFLDLAETGPVILSGDLYFFPLSFSQRRVPGFNVDEAATMASMDKVESLLARTGAELWIEHDPGTFERLVAKGGVFR